MKFLPNMECNSVNQVSRQRQEAAVLSLLWGLQEEERGGLISLPAQSPHLPSSRLPAAPSLQVGATSSASQQAPIQLENKGWVSFLAGFFSPYHQLGWSSHCSASAGQRKQKAVSPGDLSGHPSTPAPRCLPAFWSRAVL